MGNYEVAVCKDALNKLKEVETSLNPDYLKSVLHRLQLIVGELREETNPPELIEFLTKLKEEPPFAQPSKRERNDTEETLGQLVDTVLNTLGGKYYKADLSAVDLVSLNKTIAKLLKHLDPKDTQLQLRSSWTKFMLPKFEQAYEQLRKIDFERNMTKLSDAGKHFSLHLVKRDWMDVWMHYTPFYCWNGDSITEDPHYTANDTHLPCE
uniref:Uncharacterized LOC100184255 n=2 Tax=Ciona intestinalis TaxID=7719 RepID=F6QVS0_CIOIN